MTELESSIQSYFGVMESSELEAMTALFKIETLKRGECFLKEEQRCDKLGFIQSGYLRIFLHTGDKDITQWISAKGSFVTDLSGFMFENPSRWTIQALTDTRLYSISKRDYNHLKNILPKWNEFEKLFIIQCFTTLEQRIFSHLSMTAEERYNYFFENNSGLFNQVPLQYIASMLGMTPETFSRIRKKQLS